MRKGNAAVMVALMMTTVLTMGALTVDLGYHRLVASELQNAADAAALAGAQDLAADSATARSTAIWIAGANHAGGHAVAVPAGDVQIGSWDAETRTFTALAPADADDGDAVRVVTRSTTPASIFAGVVGLTPGPISRVAVAAKPVAGSSACGVFSNIKMTLSGEVEIDGYNSTAGPYGGANAGLPGGICSNDDIEISGDDTYVSGDASCGPGHTVKISDGTVAGSTDCLEEEIPVEAAPFGSIATSNSNGSIPSRTVGGNQALSSSRDLSVSSGDTLTLTAGNYYLKTLNVSGTLRTVGEVNLYVQEQVSLSGPGIVNTSTDPADVTIYTNSSSGVNISGSAAFYGSVIAPFADISISGYADYYGVFFGGKVTLSGGVDIHVDAALLGGSPSEGPSKPVLVY